MTLQTLESPPAKHRLDDIHTVETLGIPAYTQQITATQTEQHLPDTTISRFIADREELGRMILESAVADQAASFAIRCRSTSDATAFATAMRGALLTLASAFDGVSATISPNLLLHTYPAMEALIRNLESSGANGLWQPVGERSIGIGSARHVFASIDNPVRDNAHNTYPNLLAEVVAAHMIPASTFDRIIRPRCRDPRLTFVFYGQRGIQDSTFERAWEQSDVRSELK